MSKRCTKCGTFLTETDRFCPGCGENAPMEVENAPAYTTETQSAPQPQYNQAQNQYGQPSPPPYIPSPAPQYNPNLQQEEEMSVGKWFLTIFVTSLGLIGLIFLFVWGFGSGPKSRQNYCKAMLIFYAISVVLSIILVIFYVGVLGVAFTEILESASDYDYYTGYEMAKNIFTFLR